MEKKEMERIPQIDTKQLPSFPLSSCFLLHARDWSQVTTVFLLFMIYRSMFPMSSFLCSCFPQSLFILNLLFRKVFLCSAFLAKFILFSKPSAFQNLRNTPYNTHLCPAQTGLLDIVLFLSIYLLWLCFDVLGLRHLSFICNTCNRFSFLSHSIYIT